VAETDAASPAGRDAPPHETKRQADSGHGRKFDVKTFPNFASWAADHGFDTVERRARYEIFYLALPCEQDSPRILKIIRKYLKLKQPIFVRLQVGEASLQLRTLQR
jgi:hypothetical protein